jgi:uncharacterized protein YggT (Ycf19 family)
MKHRQHSSEWAWMDPEWRKPASTAFYNDDTTDPMPGVSTRPIRISALPHESWMRRFMRATGTFLTFIINKIRQLVALALTVLLLLLFTRFTLHFFRISLSQFAHWIFLLTAPLVAPFDNLHPPLHYNGYSIDVSTLVAILVYIVLAMIVLWFLRIFATWSRDY